MTTTTHHPAHPATPKATATGYDSLDTVFERFHYPAGESHIRLRPEIDPTSLRTIEATATTFTDLAQIVTADRILRRLDVEVEWFIPYFPFARHDRRNDARDGFELQFALEMVRDVRTVIADPHSDMTSQLRHFDQADVVAGFRRAGLFDNDPIVVIPDAGAAKKAYDWIGGSDVVQALKHRDPATGKLSGFAVLADDLAGRPCIIVDDICDGGGTFLGLANELRAKNAGPLTLAVTHGLFTKGIQALGEYFASIACCTPLGADSPADITIPFAEIYEKGSAI